MYSQSTRVTTAPVKWVDEGKGFGFITPDGWPNSVSWS
jgi:cold shock CspA family protein